MVSWGSLLCALCANHPSDSATCAGSPISVSRSIQECLPSPNYWPPTCLSLSLRLCEMRSPKSTTKTKPLSSVLPKCLTGIHGLDEITLGGLPRGRPTLVCGGAGCGKTLLGMEFLVRGATQFGEPGVCLSVEESAGELASNVASLGFNLAALIARKKLAIDHIYLERGLIEET